MPPTPQSNVEKYLSVIAGHGGEIPSEPTSRVEYFLNEIIKNGGIGGKLKPEIVSSLPAIGESGVLYLIHKQGASGNNVYDEYIWIEDDSKYELLGQTDFDIDLSEYVKNTRKVGNVPLSADIPISVTGDTVITVTNTGTGSAISYSIAHDDSGVTAGSKGDVTNQTPDFGGTFKVLSATVDTKGHVTALGDHTVKVPSDTATTSKDGLMSKTDKTKLDAIGVTATNPLEVTKTGETYNVTLKDSGVTAGSKGDVTNQTPGFGGTFKALSATVDAKGRVTNLAEHSIKTPDVEATQSAKGLMSAADKVKLDALQSLIRRMEIYCTASGNPATFSDGYPANVKALSVTITPTQSGSGDPSPDNVRPISGASSVSVMRTGKNLYDVGAPYSVTQDGITFTSANDGSITVSGTATKLTQIGFRSVHTMQAGEYILSGCPSGGGYSTYDSRYTIDYVDTGNGAVFTLSIPIPYLTVTIVVRSGVTMNNVVFRPMVRRATDTDPTFEPYQGQTVTVQLTDGSNPLTVYGGTLDVTTGTLSVTWANITSYNGEALPGRWISDRDVYASGATPTTGAQVVYELAAPLTYQLTPQQLAALSGYNAVSTDATSVSVTYKADSTLVLGGAV